MVFLGHQSGKLKTLCGLDYTLGLGILVVKGRNKKITNGDLQEPISKTCCLERTIIFVV